MITKAQCIRWIAALRGGKYRQGHRRLRSGDQYCCLGVLGDLMAAEGGETHWSERDADPRGRAREWRLFLREGCAYGHTAELPHEWVGPRLQAKLFEMNDQKMLSFRSIADYIEEHVLPELAPEPKEHQ
jgi:hypothetical protein